MKISEKTQKMRFLPHSPTGQAENQNMYSPICLLTVPSSGQMANFWSMGSFGGGVWSALSYKTYQAEVLVPRGGIQYVAATQRRHYTLLFILSSNIPSVYLHDWVNTLNCMLLWSQYTIPRSDPSLDKSLVYSFLTHYNSWSWCAFCRIKVFFPPHIYAL